MKYKITEEMIDDNGHANNHDLTMLYYDFLKYMLPEASVKTAVIRFVRPLHLGDIVTGSGEIKIDEIKISLEKGKKRYGYAKIQLVNRRNGLDEYSIGRYFEENRIHLENELRLTKDYLSYSNLGFYVARTNLEFYGPVARNTDIHVVSNYIGRENSIIDLFEHEIWESGVVCARFTTEHIFVDKDTGNFIQDINILPKLGPAYVNINTKAQNCEFKCSRVS